MNSNLLQKSSGLMNKQFYTQESIQTVEDLINAQVYFQKFISSNLPAKDFISFENIQESLKHDFFSKSRNSRIFRSK
jgi:hypothetical protein